MQYFAVHCKDKKIVDQEISKYYPFSVIKCDEKYINFCEKYVNHHFIDLDIQTFKYAVNYFVNNVGYVSYCYALIEYARVNSKSIISVILTANDNFINEKLIEIEVNFRTKNIRNNPKLVSRRDVIRSIGYITAYEIFRILGFIFNKGKLKKIIIPTWVDDAYGIYGKYFNNSTIIIYPFLTNIIRGIKYILFVRKNFENVFLSKMDISYIDLLRFITACDYRSKLIKLIELESNMWIRHGQSLAGAEVLLCSDEFNWVQIGFAMSLMSREAVIIGTTHGINRYSPYILYDRLYCFNESQSNFYSRKNNNIEISLIKKININGEKKRGNINIEDELNESEVVILVDQGDFSDFGLFYEYELFNKVLKALNNSIKKKVFIKFHPNRKNISRKNLLYTYKNVKSTEYFYWDELNMSKFIYVNLYSTAYFDIKKHGSVIFIKDFNFSAITLFGNEIDEIHVEKFIEIV